jgi:UDP-N-acetylmuramoylalanine--D-glutamate ligase
MIPDVWRRGEVAVIGLGRSGVAAARWLAGQGIAVYASDVVCTPATKTAVKGLPRDRVAVELGRHDLDRIRRATGVVVSPGVPPDAPPLVAAREAGCEVVAELDLAARVLGAAQLIVVTGTNGKTTTTALIAHLLRESGVRSAAGGNIGRPLIDLAGDVPLPEWIAVEASSFQLHDAPHLAPAVGVVTNLAPDHLDRYPTTEAYYADKRLLFRNATSDSTWILNADDAAVLELARGVAGAHRHFSLRRESHGWLDRETGQLMLGTMPLLPRNELHLLGEHNVANALAAALAVRAAGVGGAALARGLATFQPLEHRLEPVTEVGGVLWINDSKATNVAAAVRAVQALHRPFVLIAGGHHKGESYAPLASALSSHCRAVVAYGEASELLASQLEGRCAIRIKASFDDAVRCAASLARPGDAVLLAPACASFDQFTNFEERGDRFRKLVNEICAP